MSKEVVIFILACAVTALVSIILYQRYQFKIKITNQLIDISGKIRDNLQSGSDEKVLVFTDHEALIELSAQINCLIINNQKLKAEYKKTEISSGKMLSNISHDIKTPLTVILGYLEMMRLKDEKNEMLIKVENKANQVMQLVNEFFTLAKLEAGDSKFKLEIMNINEICRETILDFYCILQQKEFEVEVSIPDDNICIQGDKEAVGRILNNLISNAVNYGEAGKYLGLILRDDKENVLIDIVDKGKGIDRISSTKVFERLYTMEDSRNRDIQGNGLGLTIARNLAVQMGGDIILRSEPGIKTSFTVLLKKFRY